MVKNLYWRQVAAIPILVLGMLSIWGTQPVTGFRLFATASLVAVFFWVLFWPNPIDLGNRAAPNERAPR